MPYFCLFPVLTVLLSLICLTTSCTCNMKHPQQHFCDSDFVIKVRPRRPVTTPEGLTVYKIRFKRILKLNEKAQIALSKNLLYTIPGQCEARLMRKTSYVIAGDVEGGKPWVSSCNFISKWRDLSRKMKKGLQYLYQMGCPCPIMSCHWWNRCPSNKHVCNWETSREEDDCQERHGVCLRKPDGNCSWFGGRPYRSCMRSRSFGSQSSANDIISSFKMRKKPGISPNEEASSKKRQKYKKTKYLKYYNLHNTFYDVHRPEIHTK